MNPTVYTQMWGEMLFAKLCYKQQIGMKNCIGIAASYSFLVSRNDVI